MSGARSFEDLWIWQTARGLVKDAYSDFGIESPAIRDFGFQDQIRRAAMSVMNNIAEGLSAAPMLISPISCGSPRGLAARFGVCSIPLKISVTRCLPWQPNVEKD